MNDETWPCDRLVVERIATLWELENYYSIDDVQRLNSALDGLRQAQSMAEGAKEG